MRSGTSSGRSSGVMKSAAHTPARSERAACACAGAPNSARARLAESAIRMDVLTRWQPAMQAGRTSTLLPAIWIDAVDVVRDHVDAFGGVRAQEAGEALVADVDRVLLEIPAR